MGDIMRPVPFGELIERIFQEYKAGGSIFGIPEKQFFRKPDKKRVEIFGETCETVLGPAAGPHTQLTQNIITSYLTGGRFFELKTVQILDTLEVEKPCIDAGDEGFNTEWSSEYTLTGAYDEYIKAWILLHLLEEVLELKAGDEHSFIFNMSVGYDLEGIQNPRVDAFITDLMNSGSNQVFRGYLEELEEILRKRVFLDGTGFEKARSSLSDLPSRIPAEICSQVTLSTMHGCPPKEIEAICAYMLKKKKLNTYVKLNPTLLGFKRVRSILDDLGFDYVSLKEESFLHDLQYSDAVPMLSRLKAIGDNEGLGFGVKLTNTLGSVNDKGVLPGDEMYMSGRPLFPLSINLASELSKEFDGALPISFAGGVSMMNIGKIFDTGIRPITMATDLLHPGGYLRMTEMAKLLEKNDSWDMEGIDMEKLETLAMEALSLDFTKKEWRGFDKVAVEEELPLFDCYIAPCITACPIHQDIPEYIGLVGQKKYKEAVALIYEKNALPSITGYICAHQCMYTCTRLDYEGSVRIREMKKIAIENGFDSYRREWQKPGLERGAKVAVIGAGPAGLSAAYFLSREEFPVTVFDRRESAGGVVEHVVPRFRIPREAILRDIRFIEEHGVEFIFGVSPGFSITEIKNRGFVYVCIAIGAEAVKGIALEGENKNIISAWEFLNRFNEDPDALSLGRRVAVVGAGDTAMDAARASLRVKGVESVQVVYRRAEEQVPASREEYKLALEDNIPFQFLRNPERFDVDGTLTCRVMELGEKDESGRRRPVPTDRTETMHVDTLIPSIGEEVNRELLAAAGIGPNEEEGNVFLIGDGRTGPSTIVECIADGRKAADRICNKEDGSWSRAKSFGFLTGMRKSGDIPAKKGALLEPLDPGKGYDTEAFVSTESSRCLECNYICNKCVDVCPNRANIAIRINGGGPLTDLFQIVHLDAFCNECGNCGTFCPYQGRPYMDKLTLFNLAEDFTNSENPGFIISGTDCKVRLEGKIFDLQVHGNGGISGEGPSGEEFENTKCVISTIYTGHKYLLGPVLE